MIKNGIMPTGKVGIKMAERKYKYNAKTVQYNAQYVRDHFDRLELRIPKGNKDRIKEAAEKAGLPYNAWVWQIIEAELNNSIQTSSKTFAKVTTLQQAKADPRIYAIEKVYDEGSTWYSINLNDGYVFDDGISCTMSAETVKDVCRIINTEIVEGTIE